MARSFNYATQHRYVWCSVAKLTCSAALNSLRTRGDALQCAIRELHQYWNSPPSTHIPRFSDKTYLFPHSHNIPLPGLHCGHRLRWIVWQARMGGDLDRRKCGYRQLVGRAVVELRCLALEPYRPVPGHSTHGCQSRQSRQSRDGKYTEK